MNLDHTQHATRIAHHIFRIPYYLSRLELPLILFASPFLIFPRFGVTPWLMTLFPLLWLCRWLAYGRLTTPTPLDTPILGLLLMTVVSLWATFDLAASFPKLCGVVLGVALFYALINSLRTDRGIWLATALLLLGGTAVAGVGLIGVRWGARKVPILVPILTSLYRQFPLLLQGVPRAETGFNANQVGGTLALFIPLVAALLVHPLAASRRQEARNPDRRVGSLISTLGLAGVLGLMVFVLLLTQSRLSYLAVTLALLLLGTTLGRWPRLLAILVLLAGVGVTAYYGLDQVGQAIFGIGGLEGLTGDASWIGRIEIWRRALRVIQDHPLTGIGFDTLFSVIHARYPTFYHPAGIDLTHAHNIYLQVALDLGVPGFAAFVWLLVAFGRMLWQVRRGSASPARRALATGLFFGLLAQLVYGLGDAIALGQKPSIFLWAYFGLGATLWIRGGQLKETEEWGRAKYGLSRLTFHVSRFVSHIARDWRLVMMLVIVLSTVGWIYGRLARARAWLSLLESDIAALQAMAWQGPSAVAPWSPAESLHIMHSDLLGFQSEFALPLALAPYLGWVPGYGADIEAAPAFLQMGLDLASAGEEVLEPFQSLLAASEGEKPGISGDIGFLMVALQNARLQLEQALATLEEVRQTRQTIDTARLSPRMEQWILRLDRMLPLLENGIQGALMLPKFLGASEPRTYLILIQNEDELRPTGGFISGVARVVLEEGRVVELAFEDSYAVDDLSRPYPDAPAPLYEIMGTELWFLRDSNWSPDFPSSAQVAMVLYWLRYDDVAVDGVIALDQYAIQQLVGVLQPLQVQEYVEPITGENLIQAVRESWAPSEEGPTEEWKLHRKDFMGRLLTALVHRLQEESDQINLAGLGLAALRALEERHMFVYLLKGGSEVIHQAGWDGAIADVPGDYLMVIDANLGFNKVNPYITESLSYTVDLRNPLKPEAELLLIHRHQSPETAVRCRHESRPEPTYERMMHRCYWDYVRVYTPEGARLLEATPHPIPGSLLLSGEAWKGKAQVLPSELGKEVFASFLVLAPQQWSETQFEYELPPGIIQQDEGLWRYRLYIQKQGGTDNNPVAVTLSLPTGVELVAASPLPTRYDGNRLLYELRLQADLELLVDWKKEGQ